MQSESDSDNEFFDASEKLTLSGSFASESRYDRRNFFPHLQNDSANFWHNCFHFLVINVVIISVTLGKFQPSVRIV